MAHAHSDLVETYIKKLTRSARLGAILDLACGAGRNGLFLLANKIPVVFADADPAALDQVRSALSGMVRSSDSIPVELWPVDFEQGHSSPLQGRRFGGVLVFRYLHRPLIEPIKRAVIPGGMVIYETFTVDQPQFGRPKNPDYLLGHDELRGYFSDWHILHYFEGVRGTPEDGNQQAIARIVAIKPD